MEALAGVVLMGLLTWSVILSVHGMHADQLEVRYG
jgi:hypothetical protein